MLASFPKLAFCVTVLLNSYFLKIKRCAELARKLRFFRDQMSKAGVKPSAKSDAKADFNLDDVEVHTIF